MKREDYNELKKILTEFQQEIEQITDKMESHRERIRDIDARLKVYHDAEPEDFKVFSPRNMEILHREEINAMKGEKAEYERQDRELEQRKEVLSGQAKKLEKVLKRQKKDTILGEEEAEKLQESSILGLEELVSKIEQSSSQVMNHPMQVKQDLAVISLSLRENIEKMRGTVWVV